MSVELKISNDTPNKMRERSKPVLRDVDGSFGYIESRILPLFERYRMPGEELVKPNSDIIMISE